MFTYFSFTIDLLCACTYQTILLQTQLACKDDLSIAGLHTELGARGGKMKTFKF